MGNVPPHLPSIIRYLPVTDHGGLFFSTFLYIVSYNHSPCHDCTPHSISVYSNARSLLYCADIFALYIKRIISLTSSIQFLCHRRL